MKKSVQGSFLGKRNLESDHLLKRFPTDKRFFNICIKTILNYLGPIVFVRIFRTQIRHRSKTGFVHYNESSLTISYNNAIGLKKARIL